MSKSGFPMKRAYPGKKGLYIEFFTAQDALNFYAKAVAKGSRTEMQDSTTVIMKTSKGSVVADPFKPD